MFTGTTTVALAMLPTVEKVVTLELEGYLETTNRPYFEQTGVSEKIDIRIGDALASLDVLIKENASFDMVRPSLTALLASESHSALDIHRRGQGQLHQLFPQDRRRRASQERGLHSRRQCCIQSIPLGSRRLLRQRTGARRFQPGREVCKACMIFSVAPLIFYHAETTPQSRWSCFPWRTVSA